MNSTIRTLVLGLDAFDPAVFERLSAQGRLPHLTRYAEGGGYARFGVTDPPQSEVSWTSIATGLNPGGHGMFDFVHRNPATYALGVSLLPVKKSLGGTRFVSPHSARTVFDHTVERGFPATALWWPATFPARLESPARTLPGLGTPDIQGRLGVGTLLTSGGEQAGKGFKTEISDLKRQGRDRYVGRLSGPIRKGRTGAEPSEIQVRLDLKDDRCALLRVGRQAIELPLGTWSPILELSFKLGPLVSVRAITRAILTQIRPHVRLYCLPLQLYPLRSPWRYASPRAFVREAWKTCGPFLTLGWPQDTTALEDGCITDNQFLALCESIFETRERLLMHYLGPFHEGLLASVFDSLDRIQHMFWRDRPDLVDDWYVKLDTLVGRVVKRLSEPGKEQIKLVVVSDHGFADLDFKVHLNRWLVERGYLATTNAGKDGAGSLQDADWAKSQAYAIGLNSMYLNLAGREGQGCVAPAERDALINQLRDDLLKWRGPDGRAVVARVQQQSEVFEGPLAANGPDLVVGYSPGYRASAETGLGKWERTAIQPNHDHWGADHCMSAEAVPGVLFCNRGLDGFTRPSYRDIPALTVGETVQVGGSATPVSQGDKDDRAIEERLKGLGYL